MPRASDREAFDALLRSRLPVFTRKAFGTVDPGAEYQHNWHVDYIGELLEACTRGEIKRLIINVPPRYLKSVSVTVAWPAWLLGNDPSRKIIAASYSHSLSLKHSTDCRLVIKSDWYGRAFPGVRLAFDQDTKEKFVTTQRGMRYATSVGGSVTGEGGNFLIVDDPHNPMQALSDVQRKQALTWFDQSFASRLNDKKNGVIVLVMQRLHANDLTGHLLEKGGWYHASLPQVAEEKTVIDFGRVKMIRQPGDPLHPAREDAEAIERLKSDIGSYAWAGQYQQRPVPAEGGMCKAHWLQRYERREEKYLRVVQSWDTAVKPKQINDPSVCTTWGERHGGWDLLQVLVRRLEYPDLKSLVVSQASAWQPDAILIEDKASGQQLLQDLRRESQLPIIAINPEADKITRFAACSALIEAGRVYLPTQAAWLTDYEAEILTFPNAAHDDQVDSTSQFLNWMKLSAASSFRIRRL